MTTPDIAVPPVSLHVYLGYRDAPAAIDWLERALGFTTLVRWADGEGHISHAELRLGGAALVVFSDLDGYDRPAPKGDTVGQGVYLAAADRRTVEETWARATAAGVAVVWQAALSEWNYRFRVRDPEGREWTMGTHVPGRTTGDPPTDG